MKTSKFTYSESLGGILPVKGSINPKVCQKPSSNILEKKHWIPFKKIPNVREMKIELGDLDERFKLHGINRKLPAKITYKPYDNNRLNRYMNHQLKRMSFCSEKTYWHMANQLIKRSNVFLVIGINHVFGKWARSMNLSSVVRLALAIRRIAVKDYDKLDYSRVYIEKSNKEWRPLGVPTPAWRVYLHMLNQLLVKFMENRSKLAEEQHGFRPNRGTISAWKVILTEVIKSRDIFEFDLRQFFDRVNLDKISFMLIKKGVPVNLVRKLHYINCCNVKFKGPRLINEFEHSIKKLIMDNADPDLVINRPRPISYSQCVRGVPQGASTSPLLATLTLEDSILGRGMKTIMYADDGLYYGDIDQPIITPNSGMTDGNIYFNLSKSNYVKKDGKWLKPLKFLGCVYDGESDKLFSKTRKGNSLEFDKWDLVRKFTPSSGKKVWREESMNESETLWKLVDDESLSWKEFVESKITGFLWSRLYIGSWNLEDFSQDFSLNEINGSYTDKFKNKHGRKQVNIFNISSFSSLWLVQKLRQISVRTNSPKHRPIMAGHQANNKTAPKELRR